MPGPYDWQQSKQATPVQDFGAPDRGTGGYARRPPMGAGGMSRFHPMSPIPAGAGPGQAGPTPLPLNGLRAGAPTPMQGMPRPPMMPDRMPPPGVVQGNRGAPNVDAMRAQMAAARDPRAAAMQQAASAANTPERMAARQAAMASRPAGGPGMAGLARQLGPGEAPGPNMLRAGQMLNAGRPPV